MEMSMMQKKKELECYEKILNGIIAVNIGVASFPVEQLSSWEGFLNAWKRLQMDSKEDIAKMIRQFGKNMI